MSVNTAELLSPARAYVYLAPVGTEAPETSTSALDPLWRQVGLTTSDSLQLNVEPQFQDVTSHQTDYPVRQIQTGETATVAVEMQQWNGDNLKAAFGGGTITEPDSVTNPGEYKFTPPLFGTRAEVAAIIEVVDGGKHYRWVYPRTQQLEGVQSQMQKGQEARLPLNLSVLGDDGVSPWYLLSDDPSFASV